MRALLTLFVYATLAAGGAYAAMIAMGAQEAGDGPARFAGPGLGGFLTRGRWKTTDDAWAFDGKLVSSDDPEAVANYRFDSLPGAPDATYDILVTWDRVPNPPGYVTLTAYHVPAGETAPVAGLVSAVLMRPQEVRGRRVDPLADGQADPTGRRWFHAGAMRPGSESMEVTLRRGGRDPGAIMAAPIVQVRRRREGAPVARPAAPPAPPR
jgi:hypothetical protein